MTGMTELLQGNRELLVVKNKVARPQVSLGVRKSMKWDTFSFSTLTLLVERQEDHLACKKLGVSLFVVTI